MPLRRVCNVLRVQAHAESGLLPWNPRYAPEVARIQHMARTLQDIYRDAAQLSDRERVELAGMLIDGLAEESDPGVEAAWAEEVERRIREVDSGEVKLISWEQVRAELFGRANDEG